MLYASGKGGVERDRYGKKAGKGALLTYGHAPTLGVVQDATLIQVKEEKMEESNDAICFEPGIAQREGGDNRFVNNLSPTLRAGFADNRPAVATAMSYDGYNQTGKEECCHTLRTCNGESPNDDKMVKIITKQDEPKLKMVYHESGGNESFEVKGDAMLTLKSTSDVIQAHNQLVLENEQPNITDTIASMRYIVRRLTPTECERLMGLPDGYTMPCDLVITDELVKEFVEIHNNFNRIMAEYEGTKPPKPKTEAQVRKWLEKISDPDTCPDAPRYKACGNGWATNQPRWILTRLLVADGIDPWGE